MKYTVKLGHETVDVEATCSIAAIEIARKKLCERWPRLWDVIAAKKPSDFEVRECLT